MLFQISLIVLVALFFNYIFERLKLPGLLGMILTGILAGPYCFDYIPESINIISGDLRKLSLIIILIRAGLGINRNILNKIGKSALKIAFIPCLLEGITVAYFSYSFLHLGKVEAAILGFIIAAVSPAVVVPSMLYLKEKEFGKNKEIPTLILAGASVDDVFALTVFGGLIAFSKGKDISILKESLNIPLSIFIGIIAGVCTGYLLHYFFRRFEMRDTKKVLIFVLAAIFLNHLENYVSIASLIAVMSIGFIILEKDPELANRLSFKFNKIWVFAEIVLFVLIGSQVNINVVSQAKYIGAFIIFVGLLARGAGVYLSLLYSELNIKERLFCGLAYIPKATVQAAVGAIPLSLGIEGGEIILAVAVLSIVITAPLGSVLIKNTAPYLLKKS